MVDDPLALAAPHSSRPRWWSFVRKIVVAVVGIPVALAGIVMLVTPGPGIPVLIAGLAILAIEFAWAERHVDRMRTAAGRVFRRRGSNDQPDAGE